MNIILESVSEYLYEQNDIQDYAAVSSILTCTSSFALAITPNFLSKNEFLHGELYSFLLDVALIQKDGETDPHKVLIPTLRFVNTVRLMCPHQREMTLAKEIEKDPDYLKKFPHEALTAKKFTDDVIPKIIRLTEGKYVNVVNLWGGSKELMYTANVSHLVRRPESKMCYIEDFCVMLPNGDQVLEEQGSLVRLLQDLTPAPNLRKLDIQYRSYGNVPQNSIENLETDLSRMLSSTNKKLHFVEIYGVKLNDRFFELLAEHCPLLDYLQVGSMSEVSSSTLCDFAAKCPLLKRLSLCDWDYSTMEEEDDDARRPVVSFAENCPRLDYFDPPQVNDADLLAIAKNLKHLTYLGFGSCDSHSEFCDATLITVWKECRKLKTIEISCTAHISADKLTVEGFKSIGDYFEGSKNLKEVNRDGKDSRADEATEYIEVKIPGIEVCKCY